MVSIRLARTGAKKKPSYRVVVMDKRRARNGKNIEIVGFYNPRLEPIEISLKRERIDHWLSVGAQPSETVKRLIKYFDEHGENVQGAKIGDMRAAAEGREAKPVERPAPKAEEAPAEEAPAAEAKADDGADAKTDEGAEAAAEATPEAAAETAAGDPEKKEEASSE